MGQVYNFQDPLPFKWQTTDIVELPEKDIVEEFGAGPWNDPGPCIICGTPHTACTGEEEWNNNQ